jgi:hypothetical protein
MDVVASVLTGFSDVDLAGDDAWMRGGTCVDLGSDLADAGGGGRAHCPLTLSFEEANERLGELAAVSDDGVVSAAVLQNSASLALQVYFSRACREVD